MFPIRPADEMPEPDSIRYGVTFQETRLLPAADLPDDVLTRVLDRVWCSATDAATSADVVDETTRERYRVLVLTQARAVLTGDVDALYCRRGMAGWAHCNHWQNGDAACCACGRASWQQTHGVTQAGADALEAEWRSCPARQSSARNAARP
jgi:hypothetical protein